MNKDKKIEIAFSLGFAYGSRYGYESVVDGIMTPKEIGGTWVMSSCLFRRLYPLLARKPEKCSMWPELLKD